ncbi:TRAP transporter fused permease subunit [Rhodospirillaceae bacterium SYSU D60014]|uniref:TRAP transporter permease n=1 Tax=Virgifigura deserti TaxID=2268457 RepID=UPI0013C3ED69
MAEGASHSAVSRIAVNGQAAVIALGAALIAFTIYTSATIPLQPTVHRGVFLLGIIYMALLLNPLPGLLRVVDGLLAAAATVSIGYLVINWEELAYRSNFEPTLQEYVLGVIAVGTVLELTRRAVGWPLALVAVIALLYALFGRYVPEPFMHKGFSLQRVVVNQYLTHEGLFSSLLGVAVTLVATFLLFGALLQHVGVADLFMKLAAKLSFGAFGGPGKIEVVSSAFMGTISGSSTANVVTTGTTTIPLMRRAGFSRTFAAGVEAVSSTGGQIMPPVMGVAAFLMAEVTGIPYATIALAAIIPAALYFVCVFIEVDLESRRLNLLTAWGETARASVQEVLRKSYLLLPIVVLAWLLFAMYSPTKAAFWGCVAAVLVGLPRWRTLCSRGTLATIVLDFCRAAITVVLACATAGIIVGILSLTGASLQLSYGLVELAGQNAPMLMLFVMVLCIILGMGLPTPAAYAVAAAFAAPMLTTIGIDRLAAHMFVLFFASLSSITPPVAIAAYAAAGIAGASPMRTALVATKLGLSAFIIPFLFAEDSALFIGQAPFLDTVLAAVTALIGVAALAVSMIGYYRGPVGWIERGGYFAAAILLMHPAVLLSVLGLVLGAVLLGFHLNQNRRRSSRDAPEQVQLSPKETQIWE